MGASKGLGRAIAESLAREGARVAIASRSAERIEQAAASIAAAADGDVKGFAVDTADVDRLPVLVSEVSAALGRIEILVTNTGGPPAGDPLGFSREEWET